MKSFRRFLLKPFGVVFMLMQISCASSGMKEKSNGIFTGCIYDESNNPVSGMALTLSKAGNALKSYVSVSDENGFFSYMNIQPGEYEITGKQNGYSALKENFSVSNEFNLYCFTVSSAENVFNDSDELIKKGDYKGAVTLVESIEAERKTVLSDVQSFYLKKLKKNIRNKKEVEDENL